MKEGRRQGTARTRYLWALGFSLTCHAAALALVAASAGPSESDRTTAIVVVALMAGGGAGDGDIGDTAAADGATGLADAPPAPEPREQAAEPPPAADAPRVRERGRPARVASGAPRVVTERESPPPTDAGASVASVSDRADASAPHAHSAATGAGSGSGDAAGSGGSAEGAGGMAGDLRASCRSCPTPEYPARARRQGWQGTVDVQLHVGPDGVVEQAEVGRSSGFTALDAAAVTVARRSRFWVSRGDGLRGRLRYRFVLEEAARRPL